MNFGSMANDGGFLLLDENEKNVIVLDNSQSDKFIKKFSGGAEFLRGINKFCLWIKDTDLEKVKLIPSISGRINSVKIEREKSGREVTKK